MHLQTILLALGLCASLVLGFDPMEGITAIICIISFKAAIFAISFNTFHETF